MEGRYLATSLPTKLDLDNLPPPRSRPIWGTYILTVTGNSSHITLTHTVRALAQVELSTYSNVLPGSTIQAFGNGFLPNESLLIYMDLNKSAGVTLTTDSTGAFSVTLAVPSYYKTSVNNQYGLFLNVYAVDIQQQKVITKNGFNLAPLVLNSPYGASTTYGQPLTLNGFGFAANATVKLYWNYHLPSQITLGTVQADSNGSFSITLPTPSSPNLSQVPVAAIDISSKLAALSTFNDQPGITLNPSTGVVGSTLNINGGSFGANEPISITFGSIALPTVTTDTYGTFTTPYTVPTGSGTGIVTVTVKGGTSGISLNTGFEYVPQLKITPTNGTPGTTVTLIGQYFGTGGVQLTLVDPATGTNFPLGFAYLPGDGSFFDRVTLPTNGLVTGIQYELQAYDQSKGLTAQAPFILKTPGAQSLQVGQTLTVPGSIANVTGSGFTPGEGVQVYFQNVSNGAVQTTVDAQGNISTSLKLPVANFTPKKSYFIYASGTTTSHRAQAQIVFELPQIFVNGGEGMQYAYQAPFYLGGSGYASGEAIRITWDYGAYGKQQAGTVTAAADGTFSTYVPFPSYPVGATTLSIIARGTASGITITDGGFQYAVEQSPQINLSPTTGPAGTTIKISGGNFQALGAVTVAVNGKTVFTGYPNTFGAFNGKYTIPVKTGPGTLVISANEIFNLSASATFTVVPTITVAPPSGTVGTSSITISGASFTSSNTAEIWWFDPLTYQSYDLGPVNTSVTGSFSQAITPPETLTSGTTYSITVYDNATGISTQATFSVQ